MIYKYDDFIDELKKLHPEIEEKSLALIAKRGLQGINRVMRSGQELLLRGVAEDGANEWIKFFIYMTPEDQHQHATKNFYKKKRKKELQQNEKIDGTTSNK